MTERFLEASGMKTVQVDKIFLAPSAARGQKQECRNEKGTYMSQIKPQRPSISYGGF